MVSGSYPWRGGERQVELAMATRGRSPEMWAALAASGVSPLSGPGVDAPVAPPPPGVSYGVPRSGFGAAPQLPVPAGAPGSTLVTAGLSANIDVPTVTVGAPREFRGVVAQTGTLPATDPCVISWVLSPIPSY